MAESIKLFSTGWRSEKFLRKGLDSNPNQQVE